MWFCWVTKLCQDYSILGPCKNDDSSSEGLGDGLGFTISLLKSLVNHPETMNKRLLVSWLRDQEKNK